MIKGNQIKVIIASHRRSGTHLTIDSLANNIQILRKAPAIPSVSLDRLKPDSQQKLTLEEYNLRIDGVPCLLKTHALGNLLAYYEEDEVTTAYIQDLYQEAKKIYVHRDGRDVLVSLYHYETKLGHHKEDGTFSEYLRGANKFDINTYPGELSRVAYWVYHVQSWLNKQDVLLVSYNELQENYVTTLSKMAEFIGEPLQQDIKDTRRRTDRNTHFSKLIRRINSRVKGVRYSSVSFRKGISGDWKNHFSEDDLAYFQKWGGALNHLLGYQV